MVVVALVGCAIVYWRGGGQVVNVFVKPLTVGLARAHVGWVGADVNVIRVVGGDGECAAAATVTGVCVCVEVGVQCVVVCEWS